MDVEGSYRIEATRDTVWHDLNDPEVLRECIPGCDTIERIDATRFDCVLVAKYGPARTRFKCTLRIEGADPPNAYTLVGEGKGGVAGAGKGRADVVLASDDGATLLEYNAEFSIGGKLARMGSRLLASTTRRLCDRFFSTFAARYEDTPA